MLKILLGFFPWILYFILLGKVSDNIAISAVVVSGTVLDFSELKKGFVLPWATLIYFLLLLGCVQLFPTSFPVLNPSISANCALALIAWGSLAINKPFTLQYAREQVEKKYWLSPGFIFVNRVITVVWALSFSLSIGLGMGREYIPYYWVISDLPSLFALWFTIKFPDWYKRRKE